MTVRINPWYGLSWIDAAVLTGASVVILAAVGGSPVWLLAACLTARYLGVLVHELGHVAALLLVRVRPTALVLGKPESGVAACLDFGWRVRVFGAGGAVANAAAMYGLSFLVADRIELTILVAYNFGLVYGALIPDRNRSSDYWTIFEPGRVIHRPLNDPPQAP